MFNLFCERYFLLRNIFRHFSFYKTRKIKKCITKLKVTFSSVQSLSCVQLFASPWTEACQASLSTPTPGVHPKPFPLSWWCHPAILCRPLLLLLTIFPSIRVFSNESSLRIRWPKYWNFSLNIIPTNEHSGLISFRMDWLDLLAVQRTLKNLLQHHSSKASIRQR